MFLKRLDVIGFKSFAERISVDFVKALQRLSDRTEAEKQHHRCHSLGSRRTISPVSSRRKMEDIILPAVIRESD